jgi:simple sugar transport system substrate-binding protein
MTHNARSFALAGTVRLDLQIDRGIAAANLATRAQLVTKTNLEQIGKRFEN